ncbi:MAG: hypothetical protein FD153_843 [Rhodospirillaceae bacterium]|nr:MAG: hypothetical protein FD153_843 [Rhodospirillaceae bacterium]
MGGQSDHDQIMDSPESSHDSVLATRLFQPARGHALGDDIGGHDRHGMTGTQDKEGLMGIEAARSSAFCSARVAMVSTLRGVTASPMKGTAAASGSVRTCKTVA